MAVTARQSRARMSRQESRERIVGAATELVRRRSYAELSVDEVMTQAGLGRTIFYRHFDDLADLVMRAAQEAINELYEAQRALGQAQPDIDPDAVRRALQTAVDVYQRHGPLLRAVAEAAAGDPDIARGHLAMRARFDDFVAESLAEVAANRANPPAVVAETARALNLMNEHYLLDAFGREPRVSVETAVQTLTEIWIAVVQALTHDKRDPMPIEPDAEQFNEISALAASGAPDPVVMLNLNRYRDVAVYAGPVPGGASPDVSGREAYARYGEAAVRMLERVGGRILWYTQAQQTVIGDETDRYDEVIAVWYPNVAAFVTFGTDPDIAVALAHRTAGLERAAIIRCDAAAEPALMPQAA